MGNSQTVPPSWEEESCCYSPTVCLRVAGHSGCQWAGAGADPGCLSVVLTNQSKSTAPSLGRCQKVPSSAAHKKDRGLTAQIALL